MSENVNKNDLLLGISCIVIGLGYLAKNFNLAYSDLVIILGYFFFCKSLASSAYATYGVWGGFGQNFGENISLLSDAVIKIIDYLRSTQ